MTEWLSLFSCNTRDSGLITGLGRSPGEGIGCLLQYSWASLAAQLVKNPPAMWETWIWSLYWDHSPGEGNGYPFKYSGLKNSMDCVVLVVTKSQRHDWATFARCWGMEYNDREDGRWCLKIAILSGVWMPGSFIGQREWLKTFSCKYLLEWPTSERAVLTSLNFFRQRDRVPWGRSLCVIIMTKAMKNERENQRNRSLMESELALTCNKNISLIP